MVNRFRRKDVDMSEYRTEWTPQQVQDNLADVNESLPEATTTDRFRPAGRASGLDVRAGEDLDEQQTASAAAEPGSRQWLPSDPPRRPTPPGGE
jgi:hypothetical protein